MEKINCKMTDRNGWESCFAWEKTGSGIRILRCFSYGKSAEIPAMIEGIPVTELAPYVFSKHMDWSTENPPMPVLSGNQLEEIIMPDSIQKIGRYAFYNCGELKSVHIPTGADLGAGAFTGCHKIRNLYVKKQDQKRSCFREVLMEIPEELQVCYEENGTKAELWFPEYFEEGVENTPARILVTHTHGTGIQYRNCFINREFQFREYDRCFSLAKAQESVELLIKMAGGRILSGKELSQEAEQQYGDYLRENTEKAAELYLENQDKRKFLQLVEKVWNAPGLLEILLQNHVIRSMPDIFAELMERKRRYFSNTETRKRKFEL